MESSNDLVTAREQLAGKRLYVVPYCHPDWAWTHTRRWHELRYVKVLQEVLDILAEQDREGVPADAPEAFRWYADCYRTAIQPFLQACPGREVELRKWVEAGRIGICGGFSNVRINHVEGETFLRSIIYGKRRFRQLFPQAELTVHSDIVDVAVGHPQLPQILSLAGYRYLQFWRPHEALNAKDVPYHFLWDGLDGTRVLCSRGCYSGLAAAAFAPPDAATRWDEVVTVWWQNLLQDKNARSPADVLWLPHGADDSRPLRTHFFHDAPLDLVGVVREWNGRETSRLAFATPAEVFEALEERRDELPIRCGTLDPCDVAYNAAWAGSRGLWKLRSQCANAICRAETVSCLSALLGVDSFTSSSTQSEYEALWEDALLFSGHAIQWLFQQDFDEIHDLARRTLFEARRARQRRLEALSAQIATPPNALAVLFNPLPYERSAVTPLRITFAEGDRGGVPADLRLVDAGGVEVPYQTTRRLEHAGTCWELETLVEVSLPAGGWNVVCWEETSPRQEEEPAPEADAIDNGLVRLEFSRGRLTAVNDALTGATWEAPAHTPFGHVRCYAVDTSARLHVGPITGSADAVWESWGPLEQGPVRWTYRSEGRAGPHRVRLDTRVYRGERRVEFQVHLGWAAFDGFAAAHLPLPGPGRLVADMPFCLEAKRLEEEPYVGIERGREGMFIAQSFVQWTDGQRSIAYVSHDGDRYFVLDQERDLLAHILVNSVRRPRDTWEQYVNAQMEGEGEHDFTYSILPDPTAGGGDPPWRTAAGLRAGCDAAWPRGEGGRLPPASSALSVSPANVMMSACYAEGDRVLVRFFETAGTESPVVLTMPAPVSAAEPVGLLGDPLGAPCARVDGATVSVTVAPWQILTLAITPRPLCESPAGT